MSAQLACRAALRGDALGSHGSLDGALTDPAACEAKVAGRTVNLAPDQGRNAALIAAIG